MLFRSILKLDTLEAVFLRSPYSDLKNKIRVMSIFQKQTKNDTLLILGIYNNYTNIEHLGLHVFIDMLK